MNPIAREPILTSLLATLIAWAAARYGFKVTPDQAAEIAAAVLVTTGPYARQLVKPTAKIDAEEQEPADTTAIREVVAQVLNQMEQNRVRHGANARSIREVDTLIPPGRGGYPSGTTRVDEMPPPPPDPGKPGRGM